MKDKLFLGAQILLGLIYFVFGLNGFLQFIPMPEEMPANVGAFFQGMMATGYLFILLKATEIVFGLLLILNFYAKLSLVVLAPITLNILLFHIFTDISALPMGIAMFVLHVASAYKYCATTYMPLFSKK